MIILRLPESNICTGVNNQNIVISGKTVSTQSGKLIAYTNYNIRFFCSKSSLYIFDASLCVNEVLHNESQISKVDFKKFDVGKLQFNYGFEKKHAFIRKPNRFSGNDWEVISLDNGTKLFERKTSNYLIDIRGKIFEVSAGKFIKCIDSFGEPNWTYVFDKNIPPIGKEYQVNNNSILFHLGSDSEAIGRPMEAELNSELAYLNVESGLEQWKKQFSHIVQDFYIHKDIIYVAHRNEIAALNAESGELIRETQAGENYGNNIVWCDGNYAYLFNYGDEKAYLFDLELTQQLGTLVFPNDFILNNQHHPYMVGDEIFIPVCPKRLNMAHAEQGVIRINRTKVLNDDVLEYVNEPEFTRATVNNPDGTQSYQLSLKGDNADSVIRIGEVELRKIYTDFGASIYDGIDTRNSQFNAVVYIDMQIPESELGRFNELFETLKKRMEDWLDFMQVTSSSGKHPANIQYQLTTI
ncbi:PQQ-binding-like beta-propeller repeat protein [Algibacillus agarilyticus]|uniref:PQQ-binding-like beta-propeller repeat protein n=1 Tax=Algibacillus agarilyticus TaxID=2234133 RepID=UPI000DCFD20F|nr:PQQ-binding-like beta-propeller repeat protein [Algibacillus agarilyticus]